MIKILDMKKVIMTIAIILTMGFGTAMAQSDGFFRYEDMDARDIEDPTAPILPGIHGQIGDSVAHNTPIGSGIVFLTGLGLAYAMFRKKDKE